MRALSFKQGLYPYYAPWLYKAKKLQTSLLIKQAQLQCTTEEKQLINNFLWDRYLATKFYTECDSFNIAPFYKNTYKPGSDTLFILGCGASINDLNDKDWDIISQHDSMGINYFYCHDFKPSIHVIELGKSPLSQYALHRHLLDLKNRNNEYVFLHLRHLLNNPNFTNTNFREKTYLYSPCIPKSQNKKLITFFLNRFYKNNDLLFHHASNLDCAVHMAYQFGYKRIFLLGVDLNRKEYFWDLEEQPTQAMVDVMKATQSDYELYQFKVGQNTLHATVDPEITNQCDFLPISTYFSLVNNVIFKKNGVQFATCTESSLLRKHIEYQPLGKI